MNNADLTQIKLKPIKLVVWDLDGTLWPETLLENQTITLSSSMVEMLKTLDSYGILNSIASKNNPDLALTKLAELGIAEYFLYPQIHWGPKSQSIANLSRLLNINPNAMAFIDNEPFEQEEIAYHHPQILCIPASEAQMMLHHPRFVRHTVSKDSKNRRKLYLADVERQQAEEQSNLREAEFLKTLDMKMRIAPAGADDLLRAEELTIRSNQLNTTGYTYSYQQLEQLLHDSLHQLLLSSLDDKFGSYGTIGLCLLHCEEKLWTIKLFITSCRVMRRGIGSAFLINLLQKAKACEAKLMAEFIHNDHNRPMYMTYKFLGFQEKAQHGNTILLEHPLTDIPAFPNYVCLIDQTDHLPNPEMAL